MRFDFVFNWSNVIELLVLLFTFVKFHRSNIERMQEQNKLVNDQLAKMEARLELLYGWWTHRMNEFGD